jgi:hypothetical protein
MTRYLVSGEWREGNDDMSTYVGGRVQQILGTNMTNMANMENMA